MQAAQLHVHQLLTTRRKSPIAIVTKLYRQASSLSLSLSLPCARSFYFVCIHISIFLLWWNVKIKIMWLYFLKVEKICFYLFLVQACKTHNSFYQSNFWGEVMNEFLSEQRNSIINRFCSSLIFLFLAIFKL